MKFLVIGKKGLAFLLIIIVVIFTIIGGVVGAIKKTNATVSPSSNFIVAIDAGHGGIDGGCVGRTTGITESYLNLQYAKTLEKLCKNFGMKTIMTRKDMEGLYSPLAKNKKKSEMEKREKIIKDSNADIVISIHMNSVPSKKVKGAQVFYKKDSDSGRQLADDLTFLLNEKLDCIRGPSKEGDFYVLNCNNKASVLVECGYLSNPDEEILMAETQYMHDFCTAIFGGIINFLRV